MTEKIAFLIAVIALAWGMFMANSRIHGGHEESAKTSSAGSESTQTSQSQEPIGKPTPPTFSTTTARSAFSPTRETLLARVKIYYESLSSRKFGDVWTDYLGSSMKLDTPREDYLRILASSVGRSEFSVAGPTEVTIETTGEDKRPLGRSITPVRVKNESATYDATHTTYWVVEEQSRGNPTWVLARDALLPREKR